MRGSASGDEVAEKPLSSAAGVSASTSCLQNSSKVTVTVQDSLKLGTGRIAGAVSLFTFSHQEKQQKDLQHELRNKSQSAEKPLQPGFFVVEKVVDERMDGKVCVKWKNCDSSQNTWKDVKVEPGDGGVAVMFVEAFRNSKTLE